MTPLAVIDTLKTRKEEINEYLTLLRALEISTQDGPPTLGSSEAITPRQTKVLYASVYVQLYNMIEAVVSRCIDDLFTAIVDAAEGFPAKHLNLALQEEWVRAMAKTHANMEAKARLKWAKRMFEHLVESRDVIPFKLDVGGGGNWDDDDIATLASRLGWAFEVEEDLKERVKHHVRDNMGALKLVKERRNALAHGRISFVECAEEVTVGDLINLSNIVIDYLEALSGGFVEFIQRGGYLLSHEVD